MPVFITVHNSSLGYDGQGPVHLRLADGELVFTSTSLPDGSPNWDDEGYVDVRGLNDDEVTMCEAFQTALVAAGS